MGRQTFVLGNGLSLGALNSQSLGPGSMPGWMFVSILSSSPVSTYNFVYPSPGANALYKYLLGSKFHLLGSSPDGEVFLVDP